jgi:hypothetical protein
VKKLLASLKLSNVLTIVVVVSAAIAILGFALGQIQYDNEQYQANIRYQFTRISLRYDYSCDENVYGLYVNLQNNGSKIVQNLQVSVTNELCVGSIPPLPGTLDPGQSIQFYVYTTEPNGTITVSGNNTEVFIRF